MSRGALIELVMGLGNPGPEYAHTRHNVGFMVVDELARRQGVSTWSKREHSVCTRAGRAPGYWLAKPQSFMNRSGVAATGLVQALDLAPDQMLVVVDDVDLDLGRLRIRRSGGPGTHNGLRDIVDEVGDGFPRLRLGVRGEDLWADLADYVLSPFPAVEVEAAEEMVRRAADAVQAALRIGIARAMNEFNRVEQGAERPTPES